MSNVSLYLNINHFLASGKKIKCFLKNSNINSKFAFILPIYQDKSINKFSINSFRLWSSQFLSNYLICKARYPGVYKGNFLKKIIIARLNVKEVNLFYTFYSTGLQIARMFNDKTTITTLKDIFIQAFIEIIEEIFFNLKLSFKIVKFFLDNFRDFERSLIKRIKNPISKLKKYYLLTQI
nr:hypothetical protein CcurKRNrm1_p127 [Cryptomonas curvata]